ncbi:hypothetical protein EG327_005814 [Venturia inaequalis]|uniref:Secreted protein n=1 Tax=Venturia inaequalis TaxID=5025 RepID=A0A8H3V7I3_VENIN|nr:hypothetical protein EG327_005814 [Venturia inaequalis]
MHLQTLLPAILFAQSSFGFYCCYQIQSKFEWNRVNKFVSSEDNVPWYPRPGSNCKIAIQKTGGSCATWTWQIIQNSCTDFNPIKHIGPVDAKQCPPDY